MITINQHTLREPTPGSREYSEYIYYTAEVNDECLMEGDAVCTASSEMEMKAKLFDYLMQAEQKTYLTKEVVE